MGYVILTIIVVTCAQDVFFTGENLKKFNVNIGSKTRLYRIETSEIYRPDFCSGGETRPTEILKA